MMNLLVYVLVYPLIWFISILPFRVLYVISDFFYLLIYYVFGYRKKVVYNNLLLAFPKKSNKELIKIQKKFYHHFVDVFIEMIKSFTISEKELRKRCTYTNINVINDLHKNGNSVILIGSHYANWEWLFGLSTVANHKCYTAYTKVSNKYFNRKILTSRGRFGFSLKPTSKIISKIESNYNNKIQALYGLLSDQSPQLKKSFYWGSFLGIKVPIHTGAEMLAKKYNMPLVFIATKKIKRGFYESSFSLITNEPKKYADYELTDIYLDKLEEQIRTQPEHYFWTHKRFKHKDKAPK
jgi:Kdo2-lipid IVA lauroyltransferase/acyltransferase